VVYHKSGLMYIVAVQANEVPPVSKGPEIPHHSSADAIMSFSSCTVVEISYPYPWPQDANSPRTREWLATQRGYEDRYFS
jgi:hypothetical protein